MKRIFALLLASVMLLSLTACKQNEEAPTTPPADTEPVDNNMEHFDLNEIDLEGIGELFAQTEVDAYNQIQLDGLSTPVILELEGTSITTISAYGTTVCVAEEGKEYAGIYGNLSPAIYEQDGVIFLTVWYEDKGYSCVLFPDGSFAEGYPSGEVSIMIYLDEEGRMCYSRFALKFIGIQQWDTGPIDMAVSRDDFYYSIDDAVWTGEEFDLTEREFYTISDWFELDEIFSDAKEQGLYPEFDTLEELLEYNEQRFREAENTDDVNSGPDSTQEQIAFFDQNFAVYDYDSQKNLISETYYDPSGDTYFTKTHTYDTLGNEVSGSWCFYGEEVYSYTKSYNKDELLTEFVWYQQDQEVERFSYTYYSNGSHTQTFFQKGEKKYTYTFDATSALIAHSIFRDGEEIKTEDVSTLVETDMLTDLWLPIMDSEPFRFHQYYNGTVPAEDPSLWNVIPGENGGRIVITGEVDEEDGQYYSAEHHYDSKDRLLKVVYKQNDMEYGREEYEYVGNFCVREIGYDGGVKEYTCKKEYNKDGLPVRSETTYTEPQTYYISMNENGEAVDEEVSYTVRTEAYSYDDRGLLTETVVYEDGKEKERTAYTYNAGGHVTPRLDTFQYIYHVEGIPEGMWLIYEDQAAGAALMRCRTVYVTPENAQQLQEIFRNEIRWI